ncbi:MAG: hypothetical protein ACTSRZ_05350 [Promethearchaeota archaeon]
MIRIKRYILPMFIFAILMFPIAYAINYNAAFLVGKRFDTSVRKDEYTGLFQQDISFSIYRIVTEEAEKTDSEPIEGYRDGAPPAEWHASRSITGSAVNYEAIAQAGSLSDKTNFLPFVVNKIFPIVSKDSGESLNFIHYSYEGYNGESKPCEAWYNMPDMTIGVVSFDAMVHINASLAKFYFALDNIDNNSRMVYGYFTINESTPGNYQTNAYVFGVGSKTGELSTTPTLIYQTQENEFGWIHVEIFFDTWNDLYNISFRQYTSDLSAFIESSPVSYVVKGLQNDGHNRTNTGVRLSPSHILNKIQFKLVAEHSQPSDPSKVWVDNIQFKMYEFPAVYADIIYKNITFGQESPEPKRWLNKTIVASYEPPAYPNGIPLTYGSHYWEVKTRPGLLTGWELAPTWMYILPFFVPVVNDKSIIINTILDYLNDESNPLEERAQLKPISSSYYHTDASIGPFHEMNFTLLSEDGWTFIFNSTNPSKANYKLIFEYSADLGYEGWIKEFKMYQNDPREVGLVNFVMYGTETTVPGYDTLNILCITIAAAIFIWFKIKRKIKNN